MKYTDLKDSLLSLFDRSKLDSNPNEWGFFNEREKEIKRIGYSTNITPEIIEQAKNNHIDLLLTHHDSWEFVYGLKEKCNHLLLANDITHAFFHLPLDDADFGTNASLAHLLNLKNCHKTIPYPENCFVGIIGHAEKDFLFEEFSVQLSQILQEPIRQFKNSPNPIRKVCISTGGGNLTTAMKYAVEEKCDTYLTGEYSLYSQQYAELTGMNLLVGSHTNTELPGVKTMVEKLIHNTDLQAIRMKEPNY